MTARMPSQEELDAFARKWVAVAPPLTERQKERLRRIGRPRQGRSA